MRSFKRTGVTQPWRLVPKERPNSGKVVAVMARRIPDLAPEP